MHIPDPVKIRQASLFAHARKQPSHILLECAYVTRGSGAMQQMWMDATELHIRWETVPLSHTADMDKSVCVAQHMWVSVMCDVNVEIAMG